MSDSESEYVTKFERCAARISGYSAPKPEHWRKIFGPLFSELASDSGATHAEERVALWIRTLADRGSTYARQNAATNVYQFRLCCKFLS